MGGGARTRELHPGFQCPALSHDVMVWRDIVDEMALEGHGLQRLTPSAEMCALDRAGRALVLYGDPERSAAAIGAFSSADAAAYPLFRTALTRVAGVLGSLFTSPPPDIDSPGARDLWHLLGTARTFRALGRHDGYRLLRWGPMPAADLVREWFASEPLCAALAGRGVSGAMLGPRSAGSALMMLMHEAHRQLAGGTWRARGGPGALAQAMAGAARAAGAEIRTGTAVERIVIDGERACGVVAGGVEIRASAVVSAVDPKTTFLRLIEPTDLSPDFAMKIRNYRAAGTVAKVNLALSGLPAFTGVSDPEVLSGRIHIGPALDHLERAFDHAKYRETSSEPWLDAQIPSVTDPSLAPPGRHVMSIYVHYAPHRLRGTTWDAEGPLLLDRVMRLLDSYAPGLSGLVLAREIMTPEALEREHGLFGGHIFHGEMALDQLFTMRPLLGYGRYGSPFGGLYLCGAGTHPGGFLTGASGRHAASLLKT